MTSDELSVLFVCTANVCRSPLAESLMDLHVQRDGLPLQTDSASVHTTVRTVHPTIDLLLDERDVPRRRRESQPLSTQVVSAADLILTMTGAHAIAVAGQYREARTKIFMIDHFVQVAPPRGEDQSLSEWLDGVYRLPRSYPNQPGARDVPDPIGQNEARFREIDADIDELTRRLARIIAGG